jgi:iron(III) transport system substrate-binding protein
MKRFKRMLQLGTLATSLSLALAGCGAASNSASAKASNGDSSGSSVKTSSKELVLYSAEGFDQDIATAFEKKTGIKVKVVDMSTGPLLAKMQAEKTNPQWDVAWFDGASSMQGLDNQDMLYKDYIPSNSSNYTDLGKQLESKDHAFYPVTVTAAGVIAYNTDLVKNSADIPRDWPDLLDAKYKGEFAMNNPSISGPTYPAVYGLMQLQGQGDYTRGEDFFKKMKANGMQVFDSNGPTLTNLEKGTVKYAIAQDSAVLSRIQQGKHFKIVYPISGVSTLSSNIGIDVKAPNLDAAKLFVNYVLSAEGQRTAVKANTGDANFLSIIKGVPGKQGIRPDHIKWNAIDSVESAKHENEIKQWFTQNVVQ